MNRLEQIKDRLQNNSLRSMASMLDSKYFYAAWNDCEWLLTNLEKAIEMANYYAGIEQTKESAGEMVCIKALEFLEGLK